MKKFALAGNPNCGKTTLFNALTGSTAHVGNWPGVTVDKKEGIYKKLEENVSIIDLPGVYSLSPYTDEEVITRNYILNEKPDCIINIVDVTNLERNLYLTTQLAEVDLPIVIALNMVDLLRKNGDTIDVDKLSKAIGAPVVLISATKEENIDTLMDIAYKESLTKREGVSVLKDSQISHLIDDVKKAFKGIDVENPLFHAVKLVENDEIEVKDHKDLMKIVDEFKSTFNDEVFGCDLEAKVADARYEYISKNYSNAKVKSNNLKSSEKLSLSDKIDKVLTHKWAGIPIFLCVLFLVFHLTFSEDLFYINAMFNCFSEVEPSFGGSMFEGLFWTDAGINSPGVILFNLMDNLTGGLGELIGQWTSGISSSAVYGLINDGIVSGIFAVLSFVPQILLLFLFFSILEDSGYMARVAFILDRIFRKFGLSGKAFMPMFMGFGCSVPAMINTRTLATENEKIATIRVIPFFSCGAKLPILTAIAGAIVQGFGFSNVDLITYSMYLIGIITAVICVLIMRNTTMRGKVAPFIMELPTYHAPKFKALMFHLWDKLKHYVKKAFTIILASTIVIWFLQSFTFDWKYIEQADVVGIACDTFDAKLEEDEFKALLEEIDIDTEELDLDTFLSLEELDEANLDKYNTIKEMIFVDASYSFKEEVSKEDYLSTSDSILAGVGKLITPLFTPLGFGKQLNDNGWVFGVSGVTGLIAKEDVIATFGVLAQCTTGSQLELQTNKDLDSLTETEKTSLASFYEELYLASNTDLDEGVSAASLMAKNTNITWAGLIAFIVFNMTTIPCFAAVATAKGELPKKKFATTIIFWLVTSYVASMFIYLTLEFIWPLAIFIPLAILSGFLIHFYNKAKGLNN